MAGTVSTTDHGPFELNSTTFIYHPDGTIDFDKADLKRFNIFDLTLGSGNNHVELGSFNDSVILAANTTNYVDCGGGDDIVSARYSVDTIDGGDGYDVFFGTFNTLNYDESTGSFSNGTVLKNFDVLSLTATDGTFNLTGDIRTSVSVGGTDSVINMDQSDATMGIKATTFEHDLAYGKKSGSPSLYEASLSAAYVNFKATTHDDIFNVNSSLTTFHLNLDGNGGDDTLNAYFIYLHNVVFEVGNDGTVLSNIGTFSHIDHFDIILGTGANVITTGSMSDIITVGVDHGAGDNVIDGGGGDDQITGGTGNDVLRGGSDDDQLIGGSGNDLLDGGDGNDILDGRDGTDTATYHFATAGVHVAIVEGQQDTGGAGTDILVSIENLIGSTFDDQLTGDAGANYLRGANGADTLVGGDGNDILEGGLDADRLIGGAGADSFSYVSVADAGPDARDRISDFSHTDGDRIDLSQIDPDSHASGDQSFTFIGAAAFTKGGSDYEVRVEDEGGGRYLVQADVNHDGHSDFSILVTADAPLVKADFVL